MTTTETHGFEARARSARADGRARVMALYDASLRRWPVPFEERDVTTRYGATHVVSSGDRSASPLVLLHGAGCAAPMWRSIVGPLSERFRVHALDTIGDNGKSQLADPARHPRTGKDYSDWLRDVWDGLEMTRAHVAGASMGAWIAMHHAAAAPSCVARLALLGPMGLPSWPVTLHVLSMLMLSTMSPSGARREKLIAWTVGADPATRAEVGGWLSAVMDARSSPRLGSPYPLSAAKLRAIVAPTLVILGGRDTVVGDPMKVVARARRYMPNVETEIYPDLAHAMSVEGPDRVAPRLLAFLTRA